MNDCVLHASIGLNMTKYSKLYLSIGIRVKFSDHLLL